VYKNARACLERFFIGIDSNADNMAEYSRKAMRKPAKGGARNVLFVHAKSHDMPEELNGIASQVTILFPWGSLLKEVVEADADFLKGIRKICRPKAQIRIVFGYNQLSEPTVTSKLSLPVLTANYLETVLINKYRENGFEMKVSQLDKTQIKAIPTTWAKKLAYGKDREFFEFRGRSV
jgi:16S rRNA (adenine(1408)-N(1))-methyltransferase